MSKRIETLDWLRGLMALSIMFYHILGWEGISLDSSNILGRLGIYGVSIFFILSGLSMAIVYNSYIIDLKTTLFFFIKRIFRIWPLLWLVCFYIFFQQILSGNEFSFRILLLNITTLFGFIKPSAYMATGAWSIGNEMVYYALTPLVLYIYNYRKIFGNIFFVCCISVGMFFALHLLKADTNLSDQWDIYINPFNNLFLYIGGISIYYNFKDKQFNSLSINVLLLISLLLFCFLPFLGDQIIIVTGVGRIVFAWVSLIIVFCFYKLKIVLPSFVSKPLELLGVSTYGVYILHPIIYFFVRDQLHIKSGLLLIVSISTIFISIFLYNFFELKFMKIGKKLTTK